MFSENKIDSRHPVMAVVRRLNDSAMDVFAKLPPDLQYLMGPAEKFGRYQFDDQIAGFLDRATETEMDELAAIQSISCNPRIPPVKPSCGP